MAKTKILEKHKKSKTTLFVEKKSNSLKQKNKKSPSPKKIVLIEDIPYTSKLMLDSELVLETLFDCLKDNDLDTFRDVLISHIKTVNKASLSKNAGIGRRTLYDLLDSEKEFNPSLSTIAKVLSAINDEAA